MNNNLLYSKYKIFRHIKNLDKINKGSFIVPILARIDITNNCNHRCLYCMYQKSLPEFHLCDSFHFSDMLEESKTIDLLKNLKKEGVKAIMFAGGGEPTIHPGFTAIIKAALKNKLDVGVTTNGGCLDKSSINLMKDNHFKWIRISLDASNEKTWKKIHRPISGNSFNEIIKLVSFYKKRNVKTRIGASFVINNLNWKEIEDFTKLCKKKGFDDIRISFTYQIKRENFYSKYKDNMMILLNKAKEHNSRNFYVNILKERLDSLSGKEKDYDRCYFALFSTSIGADYKIYPCCMTKYAKKHCVIDLKKSKVNQDMFKKWGNFIRKINVKKCPTCWYDNFNSMCQYYSLGEDDFQNFIN